MANSNRDIDEAGSQGKNWTITLSTVFDATGRKTNSGVRDEVLNHSLAYLDTTANIYTLFQGESFGEFLRWECLSETQETRNGLVIFKQVFNTTQGCLNNP